MKTIVRYVFKSSRLVKALDILRDNSPLLSDIFKSVEECTATERRDNRFIDELMVMSLLYTIKLEDIVSSVSEPTRRMLCLNKFDVGYQTEEGWSLCWTYEPADKAWYLWITSEGELPFAKGLIKAGFKRDQCGKEEW